MAFIQYFAYGSNMLMERLQERCSSAATQETAIADDHALAFDKQGMDGSGKATLHAIGGFSVPGVLYKLDEAELIELDKYEGANRGYDRVSRFPIRPLSLNRNILAVTYIASAGFRDATLKPFDWYLSLVLAGARQHGLPKEWIAMLSNTPVIQDPEANRPTRQEALALLKKVELACKQS